MEGMSHRQIVVSTLILVMILLACAVGLILGERASQITLEQAARNGDRMAVAVRSTCNDPSAVQNGLCASMKAQWQASVK